MKCNLLRALLCALLLGAVLVSPARANGDKGAIFPTTLDGSGLKGRSFDSKCAVYLAAGNGPHTRGKARGLPRRSGATEAGKVPKVAQHLAERAPEMARNQVHLLLSHRQPLRGGLSQADRGGWPPNLFVPFSGSIPQQLFEPQCGHGGEAGKNKWFCKTSHIDYCVCNTPCCTAN